MLTCLLASEEGMITCHLKALVQVLAATAVIASAINIGGGFTITQRMLGMFRRPGDPDEHNHLLAIPGAALLTGAAAGHFLGKPYFPLQK